MHYESSESKQSRPRDGVIGGQESSVQKSLEMTNRMLQRDFMAAAMKKNTYMFDINILEKVKIFCYGCNNLISEPCREVFPFANTLVQFFQKAWEDSSGESLLQIQLLIALRNFVVALGHQSPCCYNMLLPILLKGIDINSPNGLNHQEDSILLWEATIAHAPAMVPQLMECFPCLVEIFQRSFDHVKVSVNIMEARIHCFGWNKVS